jgi:hypothetical protein
VSFLAILSLFLPSVFANQFFRINEKYRAGTNLIYDCQNMYFACIADEGRVQCQLERQEAIDKKLDQYPCAVLKEFDTKEQCLKKNYELVNAISIKKFCFSDRLHH